SARLEQRVRPAFGERVDLRGSRCGNRVSVRVRVVPPAVADDEDEGSVLRHAAVRVLAAAATIDPNSALRRLAPPTRAPSMSGCSNNDWAFCAVTLPPYWTWMGPMPKRLARCALMCAFTSCACSGAAVRPVPI